MFIQSYIGVVVPFAGNFAPAHWMLCKGQQLPIAEYDALYSLIGTTFGGDGDTFALPNLCGRVAVHSGQAPNMQNYLQGQSGGNETVMITTNNLPVHNHQLVGSITSKPPSSNSKGTTSIPTGNYPAFVNGAAAQYNTNASDTIAMGPTTISASTELAPVVNNEQKEPINTMAPFLAMNYIICIEGIYPPRG
jgi:microcystin-dependent protein